MEGEKVMKISYGWQLVICIMIGTISLIVLYDIIDLNTGMNYQSLMVVLCLTIFAVAGMLYSLVLAKEYHRKEKEKISASYKREVDDVFKVVQVNNEIHKQAMEKEPIRAYADLDDVNNVRIAFEVTVKRRLFIEHDEKIVLKETGEYCAHKIRQILRDFT